MTQRTTSLVNRALPRSFFIAITLVLSACGQKGALYLPQDKPVAEKPSKTGDEQTKVSAPQVSADGSKTSKD